METMRKLFHIAMEPALMSRYYERYADHAVDLGRGIAYLAGRNALDGPAERV
jgi:phosphate uptake regulator